MKRPAAAATLSHEEAEEEDGEEEKGETPVKSPANPGSKLKVRFTPRKKAKAKASPKKKATPKKKKNKPPGTRTEECTSILSGVVCFMFVYFMSSL